MAIRVAFNLGDKVRISPPFYPGKRIKIQPWDLSKFTPYGNGVYGYQGHKGRNPFTGAPGQEAVGGVLYFGNQVSKEDFEALMRILDVQSAYQVNRWGVNFWQDSEKGLAGLFGGDGDYAREELAFGFMVENSHYHVYRIWSRAWLVTK